MKMLLKRVLVLSIILLSTSCGSLTKTLCRWCDISPEKYATGKYFDYSKVTQVKQGMDVNQVIEILGSPYTISSSAIDKQFVWSYSYGTTHSSFAVQFVNGKVANTNAYQLEKETNYGIEY